MSARSMRWPPGADFSPDLRKRYYVIIGAGYGALVNHWMLRTIGGDRLEGLDVLHIGDVDPWRAYASLPMGQWPAPLTVPAIHHRPAGSDADFLQSSSFAQASENSWRDLAASHPFYAIQDTVRTIVQHPRGHFEITLADPKGTVVLADKIDVVGGPGPSRRLASPIVTDPALLAEYETGQAPSGAPRLLTGEAYLTASTSVVSNGDVCVIGGGPTAAWCVERAQALGNSMVWTVEDRVNPALTSSRRNDHLAQGPWPRTRVGGATVLHGDLFPSSPRTRFVEGFECTRIVPSGSRANVSLGSSPKASKPRDVDGTRRARALPPSPQDFDQVVVAIGQARLATDAGSWAQMLDPLLASARHANRHLIIDHEGRVVGLRSLADDLRVLGSAALSHPDVSTEWRQLASSSNVFFHSLYEQARVDFGVALSSIALAAANRYQSSPPNLNLNAVSDLELENGWQLTGASPVFPTMAATWIEMRHARIHPFLESELKLVANINRDRY